MWSGLPAFEAMKAVSELNVGVGCPSTETNASPGSMPATAAGPAWLSTWNRLETVGALGTGVPRNANTDHSRAKARMKWTSEPAHATRTRRGKLACR